MKSLRILFVLTPSFDPKSGGVQHTTFKLGNFFFSQGLGVAYYSFQREGHISNYSGELYHGRYPDGQFDQGNIKLMHEAINEFRPTHIINQMPYEKPISKALNLYKKKDIVIIACLRNSLFSYLSNIKEITKSTLPSLIYRLLDWQLTYWILEQVHTFRHKRYLKTILNRHDHFILLTPKNQEELSFFIGDYKSERVSWIPNSIPKVHQARSKNNVILYVGRLDDYQKRVDLIPDIWAKCHNSLPDWRLQIIGYGPYSQRFTRRCKDLKLPRVEILGKQDPEEFFKRAKIGIMTSAYEGFPNVLLESQSHGLVPIAFDSYASVSWIIQDDRNGILAKAFDIDDFSAKLVALAKDRSRLGALSKNALQSVKQFTIQQVGDNWLNFFHQHRPEANK